MRRLFLSILATGALGLAASAVFADPISNDIDATPDAATEEVTIAPGGSVVVGFFAIASNNDPEDADVNGCNATGADPAQVTLSVPAGVTASPNPFNIVGCGSPTDVTFSSDTVGTYNISIQSVTGGRDGSLWNTAPASFTLKVEETTPTDTDAPTTTKTVGDPKFGDNDYFVTSETEFTLACDDGAGSGCDETFYKFGPSGETDCDENSYTTYSDPFTLSGDDGEKRVCFYSTDVAGNEEEPQFQLHYLDNTAPTFGDCPSGGPFILNSGPQSVGPISVDDGDGSGVDDEASTLSGTVDTSTIGVKTVTFTAVDNLGNSGTTDCDYSVVVAFSGLLAPYDPEKVYKAGSTVPLKWQYTDAEGNVVDSSDLSPVVTITPASGCQADDDAEPIAEEDIGPGGSGLTYDEETDTWHRNFKTPKGANCYKVVITADGAETGGPFFIETR